MVFDGYGEDFGMLDEVAFRIGRWRSKDARRRLFGELSVVVEEVEILDHELDDFRIIAYIRAVGAILHCCKLDNSGLSFLPLVSGGLMDMEVGCCTLNVPFFRAVSKYTD